MLDEQVVIIGAGPAGLAAASQLSLYGIDALVLEKDKIGGLLLNAQAVINYPGVQAGISGKELIKQFPEPDRISYEEVINVTSINSGYKVKTGDNVFTTKAVIVASGTVPKTLEFENFEPKNIFYSILNLPELTNKSVAIIGGGDVALDYAMSLTHNSKFSCSEVKVYARNSFSKCVPHLLGKVKNTKAITLLPYSLPQHNFKEDIIIVAIGRKPELDFIDDSLLSLPPQNGSFHLTGDCKNGIYRQTAIAVGDGVKAAMLLATFLKGNSK